jgi:biopolymer transport protein ExbB/TolQ
MAFAFASLSFVKKLRDAGIPSDQAEAHAEAAREFIMVELVTRHDLDTARRELQSSIDTTRHDLETLRRELEAAIDNLGLRLTVRMGVMLAAGLTLLGAVLKLPS